jgi:hypothetical protein
MMVNPIKITSIISGWWFQPTPLKNDGVKVSWDDDIPNIWKVIKAMFQTTNQIYYPDPIIFNQNALP